MSKRKRISYAMLKRAGACGDRVHFAAIFCDGERTGCGVYPTVDKVKKAFNEGLDVEWFVYELFAPGARSIYMDRAEKAEDQYRKATDPHVNKFWQSRRAALESQEISWADAELINETARAEMMAAIEPHAEAHTTALAEAFIEGWELTSQAR